MHLKKGDKVKILGGKDRGKTGDILSVYPKDNKVIVDGVNLYKKRVRPKKQGQKGETVIVPRAVHASNAQIMCPNCKNFVRVGRQIENGNAVRYCKKCKATI